MTSEATLQAADRRLERDLIERGCQPSLAREMLDHYWQTTTPARIAQRWEEDHPED